MEFIIFIPALFLFLFVLYKIVKDDHVFLRKNIKLEEIFDIVFISVLIGIIVAHFASAKNSFLLPQGVLGGALGLFIIGKYKKLPLGRLFDFISLSFLSSLPLGFLIAALFSKKTETIFYLSGACIYLASAVFFGKIVFPRVMNRTLREGSMSIYILMIFSFFSLLIPVYDAVRKFTSFLNTENIALTILLVICIGLSVKLSFTRSQ